LGEVKGGCGLNLGCWVLQELFISWDEGVSGIRDVGECLDDMGIFGGCGPPDSPRSIVDGSNYEKSRLTRGHNFLECVVFLLVVCVEDGIMVFRNATQFSAV